MHAWRSDLPPTGDRGPSGHQAATGPEERDPRFALLVAELAERLRPACAGWDDAMFEALVRQIARRKVLWGEAYRAEAWRAAAWRADGH